MPSPRHPLRSHVLTLVKRGEISSLAEASLVAGVSAQSVLNWLKEAQVDMRAYRMLRLAQLRTTAQVKLEARANARPTQQEQRRRTLESVRRFNEALAKDLG